MYSWQDVVVWFVVAAAAGYLWRTLGPSLRVKKTTQVIRLASVRRREPPPQP